MSRPDRPLFTDLSVTVDRGDRMGVVGLNGTGKSTLLRVLAGLQVPESGAVRRSTTVRVAMLDQDPVLPEGPALAAVGDSWEAEAVLERLGMGAMATASTVNLSGGQRKRVALARTLVSEADLLILDEPTNHLDLEGITWLEDRLAGFRGGLILVTHDRHLLDRVTTKVLELDRGTGYVHFGGYASWLEARAERAEREANADTKRRNLARRELEWLRRGAPARTSKPKARIESATALVQGKGPQAARQGELDLAMARTPRLGNTVVELHGAGHGWDDGPDLFTGVDLNLDPRERLGIMGANGAGKSTLLDIIAGRLEPRHGRVVTGPTASIGYYDQLGQSLDPKLRAVEVVAGPARRPDWSDEAFLQRFWFDADAAWAEVGTLSGGERRRLQLVATLARSPNVLLLDEPTNDLDLDTLRALEDFLEEWQGAVVVVSHDRAFLERTVADVLVLDGHGRAARWPGGLAAWTAEFLGRRRSPASSSGASSPGAQGGSAASARPSSKASAGAVAAKAAPPRSAAPRAPGRSPSTLRQLLTRSERELDRLGKRRTGLLDQLAAHSQDHVALGRLGAELAGVDAELAEAEERWLQLASEAEG